MIFVRVSELLSDPAVTGILFSLVEMGREQALERKK